MLALYHNEGNGLFVDEAPRSEVGRRSLLTLGFATLFFDYDNDGWLDIFVANGHIENEIERIQKRVKYAESPHLFHNQGKGNFADATQSVGPDLGTPRVGRGAAYADIDNDGDLDLLMTTNAVRWCSSATTAETPTTACVSNWWARARIATASGP